MALSFIFDTEGKEHNAHIWYISKNRTYIEAAAFVVQNMHFVCQVIIYLYYMYAF